MPKVTCFGEVLWDVFPSHKKIGGAPLNVALRLYSFGMDTNIISRVGNDEIGRDLVQYVKKNGLDTSLIQIDEILDTGCVKVTLDENNSATYKIEQPVAWDNIEESDQALKNVKSSDAFIFGSLASRDEKTKNTLLNLLPNASFKVFDVNLRPPFYTLDLLLELMNKSDFIKCNDEELNEICAALGCNSESIVDQITFLSEHTHTFQICITKGKNGAILLFNGKLYNNNAYPIKVVDTVGAGDSFLATLICNLLKKIQPGEALSIACAIGALVAGKKGANPKISQSETSTFIKKFKTDNN